MSRPRGRRSNASIVANPVLVGAVTTLVIVVAVFLAYNANNGLPFVPTRQLDVLVSNGANLVKGNEVRSGGFRIGVVHRHAAGDAAQPQGRRPADAQARQEGGRRAGRFEGRHPGALRAGAQVRRARHRHLEEGLRRRRHHAGHPGVGPRRPRRGLQHVRRADAARVARQPAGLRRRPRRPRRRPQPDHRGRAAALRPPRLGHGHPSPRAPTCRRSSRSSGTPRASSRRCRRPTRTSSRRWPTPSRPSRAIRRR